MNILKAWSVQAAVRRRSRFHTRALLAASALVLSTACATQAKLAQKDNARAPRVSRASCGDHQVISSEELRLLISGRGIRPSELLTGPYELFATDGQYYLIETRLPLRGFWHIENDQLVVDTNSARMFFPNRRFVIKDVQNRLFFCFKSSGPDRLIQISLIS